MKNELFIKAKKAMENAYAPYSHFKVGAALECENGKIYTGCNLESVSFSPTVCAERCTFGKALSEGEKSFKSITVVGGTDGKITDFVTPCGVCRQFMAEFCDKNFQIITAKSETEFKSYTLSELLPDAFTMEE